MYLRLINVLDGHIPSLIRLLKILILSWVLRIFSNLLDVIALLIWIVLQLDVCYWIGSRDFHPCNLFTWILGKSVFHFLCLWVLVAFLATVHS